MVLFLGSGLKCRTCSGDGGLCSSVDDNGDSVECTGDQDACWFMSTRNILILFYLFEILTTHLYF